MVGTSANARSDYSLLDYWALLRERWLWFLLPVLLFGGLAVAYSFLQPDQYRATAGVLIAETESQRTLDPSSQNAGILSRELSNEILLAESNGVQELVEAKLGLLPDVSIESATGADALFFIATAGDAEAVAVHANTWAATYVEAKQAAAVRNITAASESLALTLDELRTERQRIRGDLDGLDARIVAAGEAATAALQREADALRFELDLVEAKSTATAARLTDLELQAELSAVGEARIVQVAGVPIGTSNTPLSRILALGLMVGLLAGFGLALLAEARDKTIKTAADVQSITDLPVLASIPRAGRRSEQGLSVAIHRDPEGVHADAYHKVRSSIEFVSFEQEIKSILVTSANAGEGKSTTSSNLALGLTSVGKRTVLIDTDFRRARIHEIYNLKQVPGLSDFILYDSELTSVAYSVQDPGLNDMLVIPTGSVPPSPAAFVGTTGFRTTIEWMESQADIIVLDGPPLLAVSDSLTLAKVIDAVVLTVMADKTTKDELREVLAQLAQVGANVVGVVLIGVDEAEGYGRAYQAQSGRPIDGQEAVSSRLSSGNGAPSPTDPRFGKAGVGNGS